MDEQLGLTLFSSDLKSRAFPVYARLRELGPATRVDFSNGRQLWLITRYNEASEVLKDHHRFSNEVTRVLTEGEYEQRFQQAVQGLTPEQQAMAAETDRVLGQHLLDLDPPDHTRLRRLVAIPFTPKYIEGLRGRIEEIASSLLDAAVERARSTGSRRMELIDDFAYPLPLTVIAEMLGIPEEDRENFRVWSRAAVSFSPAEPFDPDISEKLIEFIAYLRVLVAEKRANPGDDLLSGLVVAESEGDKLTEDELLSMMFLLIVAGHETTVNLIGNGILALFDHPDEYARLRGQPELLKSAIEEMLRFLGPVELSLPRWVREDTRFAGVELRRGDQIMVLLASANRDESRFPEPDRFDISREPNRHLAFGSGIHSCLGATLARLEGQIAFTALLARFPELALAVPRDELEWRDGTFLRGLVSVQVAF